MGKFLIKWNCGNGETKCDIIESESWEKSLDVALKNCEDDSKKYFSYSSKKLSKEKAQEIENLNKVS